MIGLIILGVAAIYIALLGVFSVSGYRWAKRRGLSGAQCRLVAAGGFLFVYLPVFWDHIPTIIAHQYYCATKAEFREFKSVEKWKAENSKELGNLLRQSHMSYSYLNKRIISETTYKKIDILPITISTVDVIDDSKGEILATLVSVGSGYGNMMTSPDVRSMKFWLNLGSCAPGLDKISAMKHEFYKLGTPKK